MGRRAFFFIAQMQLSGARMFWQVTSAWLSCYFYWRCRAYAHGDLVNTNRARIRGKYSPRRDIPGRKKNDEHGVRFAYGNVETINNGRSANASSTNIAFRRTCTRFRKRARFDFRSRMALVVHSGKNYCWRKMYCAVL